LVSGTAESPAELLHRAVQLHQSGNLAEAESLYRRILESDPDHPDALHLLGVISHQAGDGASALELIGRAIQMNSGVAIYHNSLGVALLTLKKAAEAEKALSRAIELQPDYAQAHVNLGNAFFLQGKIGEAADSYERAARLNPEAIAALLDLGNFLKSRGNPAAAMIVYRRVLAIDPGNAAACNNFGNTLVDFGALDAAIEQYERAISLKPGFVEAFMNIGNICVGRGDIETAIEKYDRALTFAPNHAEGRYNLTLFHFLKTPPQEWEALCHRFLNHPSLPKKCEHELYVRMAICHWLRGELDRLGNALDSAEEAMKELRPPLEKNIAAMRAYSLLLRRLLASRADGSLPAPEEKRVFMIGDSHCLSFSHSIVEIGGERYSVSPELIVGCKAWHLSRRDMNQYKRVLSDIASRMPSGGKAFAVFGEIDCRHNDGIIRHCKKHGRNIEEVTKVFISDYVRNVSSILRERGIEVSFLGVPAPFVDSVRISYADFMPEDAALLIYAVKIFNGELKKAARENGCGFVDIHAVTARPDGTADGSLHLDDHHLKPTVLQRALETVCF